MRRAVVDPRADVRTTTQCVAELPSPMRDFLTAGPMTIVLRRAGRALARASVRRLLSLGYHLTPRSAVVLMLRSGLVDLADETQLGSCIESLIAPRAVLGGRSAAQYW